MIGKCLAIVLFVLSVAGCATMDDASNDALRKSFAVKPDVAGLYVYCDEWMGAFHQTNVEIDGKAFGQNASYTYLFAEVAPGRHAVTVKAENTDSLEFEASVGTNYYVWQEVKAGWFSPRTKLHLVSESEGRKGVNAARLASATYRTADQSGAQAATATAAIGGSLLSILLPLIAGLAALVP